MSAARLLEQLRAAGAQLRVAGGRLEAKHLPSALAPLAKAHAAELRALLAPPPPAELPPEALGLDPNDPAATWGATANDLAAVPLTPIDRWALPPSPLPFHMRPEVTSDPARCLGCGARAMHLAQCQRCGVYAPIAGPVLPDPPPALVEPGALDGDDQSDDSNAFPGLAPGLCPGCGVITMATTGLGACPGCHWVKLPPAAPPRRGAVNALPPSPPARSTAPAPAAPRPQPRTVEPPESQDEQTRRVLAAVIRDRMAAGHWRWEHTRSLAAVWRVPVEAAEAAAEVARRDLADLQRKRERPQPPALAPDAARDALARLSPTAQRQLAAVLAMVSAEFPGARMVEIRPRARPAPPTGAPGARMVEITLFDRPFGALDAPNANESDAARPETISAEAFEPSARTVTTAVEGASEPPAPPHPAPLLPFAWSSVLAAMPPGPGERRAPTVPVVIDPPAPPPESPARAALSPPAEPDAARAARYGYVIMPSGEYIEAHRAAVPRLVPFAPRFAVGYQPAALPPGAVQRLPGTRLHADRPRPGLYLVAGRRPPVPPPPGWGWHGGASCRRCGRQGQYSGPRGHHCPDCSGPPPPGGTP